MREDDAEANLTTHLIFIYFFFYESKSAVHVIRFIMYSFKYSFSFKVTIIARNVAKACLNSLISTNNASLFSLGKTADCYTIKLLLPDPTTESISSSLQKSKAMGGNQVALYKSIDEMKDMVLAFVLDLNDLTFSIYANGRILTHSHSMKNVTFDIVNGSFSPFIRTAGAGIHVKSASNFPMPIALPGINLLSCRIANLCGNDKQ